MADNSTANVSVGKGVAGGYFYTAPFGTDLPSDYETALDAAFVNCGFITDAGITNSTSASSTTYTDLNGDDILTAQASKTRTIGVQFAEMNEQSLGEVYGHGNVSVNNGVITVEHNNNDMGHRSIVMELVLRDGRKWRRVIEDAQVTDWDDVTVAASSLLALGVTYTLNKGDETQAFIVDYIQEEAEVESE